jgi:hypothetical protein
MGLDAAVDQHRARFVIPRIGGARDMSKLDHKPFAAQASRRPAVLIPEPDIRTELARLQARYDGVIPPAVFLVVRELETELSWIEHRGRSR